MNSVMAILLSAPGSLYRLCTSGPRPGFSHLWVPGAHPAAKCSRLFIRRKTYASQLPSETDATTYSGAGTVGFWGGLHLVFQWTILWVLN